MKNIIFLFTFLLLVFTNCNNTSFTKVVEFDLPEGWVINDFQVLNGATYYIAGGTALNTKISKPYILKTSNKGKTWDKVTGFDCNEILDIFYNSGVMILSALKYTGETDFGSIYVFFKYSFKEKKWHPLKLPENTDARVVKILDENTFIFKDETKKYITNDYLITTDGGKTWSKHSLHFGKTTDYFKVMHFKDNKMWGIREHYTREDDPKGFQSIVAIDLNTWKVDEEIIVNYKIAKNGVPAKDSLWISDIKHKGDILYLLGMDKVKNKGFVWKINLKKGKKLEIQDTFDLTEDQLPNKLFIYNNKIIITYSDLSSFIPSYILLYKKIKDSNWEKVKFPDMASKMSFKNGVLMVLRYGYIKEIYLKRF